MHNGQVGDWPPIRRRVEELISDEFYRSRAGATEPLRFTAALADGRDLYAFRFAYGASANTLYYRETGGNVVMVSEPLDMDREFWKPVPPGHPIAARRKAGGSRGPAGSPPSRRGIVRQVKIGFAARRAQPYRGATHDPEKWGPVFGQDHAQLMRWRKRLLRSCRRP